MKIAMLFGAAAMVAASAAFGATHYPITVSELVAASEAESTICRDQPYGSALSDTACSRRDQIAHQLEKQGWCWGPDDEIEAKKFWMRCGPEARPF